MPRWDEKRRLQRVKRPNGSVVYSVNIPLEIIEKAGWKKGEEIVIEESDVGTNGVFGILITKEDDQHRRD